MRSRASSSPGDLAVDLAEVQRLERTKGDPRAVGLAFIPILVRHLGLRFASLVLSEGERGTLLLVAGGPSGRVTATRPAEGRVPDLVKLLKGQRARAWTASMLPQGIRRAGGGGLALSLSRRSPGAPRLLIKTADLPRVKTAVGAMLVAHLATALENAEAYRRTLDLSFRDELTSVYNYRFLMEALDHEARRSARFKLTFSLAMVDLDNLKQYNDRFGHLAGSEVLRTVGRLIAKNVRRVDVVAKYGGDEFAIILPGAGKKGAIDACERVRRRIARYAFGGGRGAARVRLTASIGVATFPKDGHSARALLNQADRALYRAKANGRNTVSV